MFRAGEATDGTSDYESQALIYLNNLYGQICRGGSELDPTILEDWAWLRKSAPGVLILKPPISSLTVTATLGSTSATLSAAPTDYTGANQSLANWFIKIGTHPDVHRITAHTSGATAITLDAAYTGSSVTLGDCTIFLTDYNLATDVLRIVAPMRTYRSAGWNSRDDYKIYATDLDNLEEMYPVALIEQGVPDQYAMIGETTTGTRRIRFNRCGGGTGSETTVYRIEYEYLFKPTNLTSPGTSEEPVLPYQWRHILSDFLLAFLFGAKNDDRVNGAAQMAQAGLRGMAQENRYQTVTATRNLFRVRPRAAGYFKQGVRRTESGAVLG